MQRDIRYYVEKAMKRTGCKSERKLCDMLGGAPNIITSYKRGTLPTDATMVKIAKLAGIDPWQALTDLNIWRADNDDVKNAYTEILRKISGFLLIIGISTLISTAPAQANTEDLCCTNSGIVYIMGNKILSTLGYIKKSVVKLYQWLMKKHMKTCLITPDMLPA